MRVALLLAALAACTETPSIPSGYVPLLSGDWMMPAGQEGYYCVRYTAPEDLYIHAFRPIAPLGTHHTALAYSLSYGADGTYPCKASDTGFKLLFGSGVGTEPYELPPGVAFKLPAGEQVVLNLHLYNAGDALLTGTSGIEIERIAPADVVHEADVIYAIDFKLQVPPGASTTKGSCTIDADSTVFGTFPHMHKLGTHMTGIANHAGQSTVFHDRPYAFEEQLNYNIDPVELSHGDTVEYDCGYENTGTQTISFGDSTDDEMCVLGMYRYPAQDSASLCISP
jgi:copper type II ascorbate-dependent monooxygenase-like protein